VTRLTTIDLPLVLLSIKPIVSR